MTLPNAPRHAALAAVALAFVGLAACGDDGGEPVGGEVAPPAATTPAAPPAATTPAAPPATTAPATPPATPGADPAAGAPAGGDAGLPAEEPIGGGSAQ